MIPTCSSSGILTFIRSNNTTEMPIRSTEYTHTYNRSRQITMPAPHHSVFYRLDALPATQPTASKHWRQTPSSEMPIKSTEYTHIQPFNGPFSGTTRASLYQTKHSLTHSTEPQCNKNNKRNRRVSQCTTVATHGAVDGGFKHVHSTCLQRQTNCLTNDTTC